MESKWLPLVLWVLFLVCVIVKLEQPGLGTCAAISWVLGGVGGRMLSCGSLPCKSMNIWRATGIILGMMLDY